MWEERRRPGHEPGARFTKCNMLLNEALFQAARAEKAGEADYGETELLL